MGINTGQITKLARKNCFNWVNIFTLGFAIVLQIFFRNTYLTQPFIYCLAYAFYSYYAIFISLQISKPSYQIQSERNYGINTVIILKTQKQNRVSIGQSLVNVINAILRNYKVFIVILAIEVIVRGGLIYLMRQVILQQMDLVDSLFDKIIDQLKSGGIQIPQDYQDLVYLNLISQIRQMKGPILKKFYSLLFQTILIIFGNSIVFYFITSLKFSLFATIHKQKHLQQINVQQRRQNNHQMNLLQGMKQIWNDFVKLSTITAYLRLSLRLFWIFLFLDLLQPYFYVCFGFLYWEAIDSSMKNILIKKIVEKQMKKKSQQQKQQSKQQIQTKKQNQVMPDYGMQVNQLFNEQQKRQQKIQEKKQPKIQHIENKRQNERIQQNNINLFDEIHKVLNNEQNSSKLNPILIKLANDINKRTKIRQRKSKIDSNKVAKNSKIQKLIYRPYYNDVIEVRRF